MTKLFTKFAAAALAIGLAVVPAFAGSMASPVGTWQYETGETRFKVEFCGDGTQLCATLVWLRDDVRTPENMALMNKRVINEADMARPMKWTGEVAYNGGVYAGNITMIDANTLRIAGCAGIACEHMIFTRI